MIVGGHLVHLTTDEEVRQVDTAGSSHNISGILSGPSTNAYYEGSSGPLWILIGELIKLSCRLILHLPLIRWYYPYR